MTGRGVKVALSLLCALSICAFVAQSASAAAAKNTTPYTCIPEGTDDFEDNHCTQSTTPGQGSFGHAALQGKTVVTASNEKTINATQEAAPAIIKGTVVGVKSEITCKTSTGEGSLTAEEPTAKEHRFKMAIITILGKCTVNKPAGFGCKVKEPIEFNLNGEAVEGLGAGKNEMGIEFKPTGEHFGSFTLEGCFLKGTFNIDGTAVATGTPSPTAKYSGATDIFTSAMTKETLKLAGNPAELDCTETLFMAGGNPISFTTAT